MSRPTTQVSARAAAAALFIPDPSAMVQSIRAGGRVNASSQTVVRWASSSIRTFDDGALTTVPGFTRSMDVPILGGRSVTAFEIGSAEPVTLPHAIAGVQAVRTYMALLPEPLNAVLRELGTRQVAEGLSTLDATVALLERTAAEPERLLAVPHDPPIGVVARASGFSGGHPAVVQCVPTSMWMTTHGALAMAALKLLSGESTRGVLSPESCLDPKAFFAEVAPHRPAPLSNDPLIRVSVKRTDHTTN